ncbi:hypothetical protein ScPMuIL_001824 [Solemya velum]
MAIHISGSVLASLFYDEKKNQGDQEGLLLGEVVNQVKDTISDSQISGSQVETKIYIYSCVPCLRSQRFYDGSCKVIPSQLQNTLCDRQKDVVGWYKFRHNSTMRISMREKAIHDSLLRFFQEKKDNGGNFLFLLSTASLSSNWSTHNLDYTFYTQTEKKFYPAPVKVINLGETTHADYRTECCHTVPQRGVFSSTINHFQKEFLDKSGDVEEVHKVHKMEETLHLHLQKLMECMTESEKQLTSIETDVDHLRGKFLQKQNESLACRQPPSQLDTTKKPTDKADVIRKQTSFDNLEERIQRARAARRLSSGRSLQLSPTDADQGIEENNQRRCTVEHKIDLIDFGSEEVPVVTGTGSLNIEINNVGHQTKPEPQRSALRCTESVQSSSENGKRLNVEHNGHCIQNSNPASPNLVESDSAIAKVKSIGDNEVQQSGDTFAFVDSLLEKAKSNRLTDSSNSEDSESTMTLPVGNQIQLPDSGAKLTNKSPQLMELTPRTRSQSSKQNAAATAAASSFETISKHEKKQSQRMRIKPGQGRTRGDDSMGKSCVGGSNQNSCLDVLDNSDSIENTVKSNKTEEILIDVALHDYNRQTPSPSVLS